MKEWTAWMANKLDEHIAILERMHLPDYVRFLEDRRRYYRTQLVGGILREECQTVLTAFFRELREKN